MILLKSGLTWKTLIEEGSACVPVNFKRQIVQTLTMLPTEPQQHHPRPEPMLAALAEAKRALAAGNIPIGAAIVHAGQVIAVGCNAIDHPADDTRHAELVAMQSVAAFLATHKRQCVLYTTLEPCMMCLGAMVNVGIQDLVVGAPDPLVGALGLLPFSGYYREKHAALQLTTGYMSGESQALLDEYVRRTGTRRHLGALPK
jgi:tRNA(adenine34) deaminase